MKKITSGMIIRIMLMKVSEMSLPVKKKDGKSHIYFPQSIQADTQRSMLDRLLESAFGGSKSQLVMQLLGNKKTSKKELQAIKDLLNKMDTNK